MKNFLSLLRDYEIDIVKLRGYSIAFLTCKDSEPPLLFLKKLFENLNPSLVSEEWKDKILVFIPSKKSFLLNERKMIRRIRGLNIFRDVTFLIHSEIKETFLAELEKTFNEIGGEDENSNPS